MALLTYPKFQAPDINGVNLAGGLVYFYEPGTTTPKTTYSDSALSSANSNPVALNARGEADIYLSLTAYKIVLKTAADVEIWTEDNYTEHTTAGEWASEAAGTYVSATSFTVIGDQTTDYHVNRRVRAVGSSTLYGHISVSAFTTLTTITVVWDSGTLANEALTVSVGLNSDNDSIPFQFKNEQVREISASVVSSALTAGLDPSTIGFRSSTITSGASGNVTASAALSIVVPSGATLGTVDAVPSRLALLAINNSGTIELAIVNSVGGLNLDETTLISTTAIDATADSNNIIYSTSARTDVPFRVVGYIESTQATAGTWDTSPSKLYGVGGNAGAILSGSFVSSEQTLTAAGSLILAHSLGTMPSLVQARLICKTAELGYSIGDEVIINNSSQSLSSVDNFGIMLLPDATNINIRFGIAAAIFFIINKTTASAGSITPANWKLIVRAWV